MKSLKRFEKFLPVFLLLITFLFFWQKGVLNFLFVENLAGKDLIGNYAFAWLMKGFIVNSKITGWSNLWLAGFPAFEFYSPLFFFVTGMINVLSFELVTMKMSYKLVIFFSLFLFPLVTYYSFRKMGFKDPASFFVSLFSLGFLFSIVGLSAVHHTLNYGLVTQMFTINLFMIFLGFLFSLKTWKGVLVSGILLGLMLLSHPFIAFLGFLGLFLYLVFHGRDWKKILSVGLLGLVISSGWWINALMNLGFMSNFILKPWKITDFPILLIPLILASLKEYKKNFPFLALMVITLFIGTSGPLIMQPMRFFLYSLLFAFLLSGLGTHEIYKFTKKKATKPWIKNVVVLAIFVPLMASILLAPLKDHWSSDIKQENLMDYIKDLNGGRILVESNDRVIKERHVLNERIPVDAGKPVLNEIHVDSSLSSPYTLLLRKIMFESEVYNTACILCNKTKPSKELAENLLDKYNVKYAIVQRTGLSYPEIFRKIGEIDGFKVYQLNQSEGYHKVLDKKPLLIISSLDKWKWLNEKLYQEESLWEVNLAWSDKGENTDKFATVIEIEGKDWEKIKEKIERYGYQKMHTKAEIRDFTFSQEKISFFIDAEEPAWVLLKFSYYPKWKMGGDIYMTNPSLMLVYGRGQIELGYET